MGNGGPNAMTFEQWMKEVDAILSCGEGVVTSDLPDQDYRTMFEEGCEPDEAAQFCIDEFWDNF